MKIGPQPDPVCEISSTGVGVKVGVVVGIRVAVGIGVTEGVPGPGVFEGVGVAVGAGVSLGVGVMLGVSVTLGVSVGLRVEVGALGALVGFCVGGMGLIVTMGVIGSSVGEGVGDSVGDAVFVGGAAVGSIKWMVASVENPRLSTAMILCCPTVANSRRMVTVLWNQPSELGGKGPSSR
jgi:hypothetical protein